MISTQNLSRNYGSKAALIDLTLSVAPGEILGFLGPNGAGKSTTVKILTGMIRPDAGRATLFGIDRRDARSRARLAYLPERFAPPHYLLGLVVLDQQPLSPLALAALRVARSMDGI